jgi:hypothetical protein
MPVPSRDADAYAVLGVEPSATQDEIRRAYRRVAHRVEGVAHGLEALGGAAHVGVRRADPATVRPADLVLRGGRVDAEDRVGVGVARRDGHRSLLAGAGRAAPQMRIVGEGAWARPVRRPCAPCSGVQARRTRQLRIHLRSGPGSRGTRLLRIHLRSCPGSRGTR